MDHPMRRKDRPISEAEVRIERLTGKANRKP